jgi:mono/diheme cytochrome c family protein
MRSWRAVVVVILVLGVVAAFVTRGMGFSARRHAWPGEERLARAARAWALPAEYRAMANPVAPSPEVVRAGMQHFADHCAICHGNDGSGQVSVGLGLFPPAPDMRQPATQNLSDGALFYAIEQGIPFSGMPAWSTGTADGERDSWELVHFIRHVPRLTAEEIREMEALNPKSAADLEAERRIQEFLKGGGR